MSLNSYIEWKNEPDLGRLKQAHRLLAKQPQLACAEFQFLADIGSVMSMRYLAEGFRYGRFGSVDLPEAKNWYQRAGRAGDVVALYHLGRLQLKDGECQAAVDSFERAVNLGFPPAAHMLGRIFFMKKSGLRDLEKAEFFLRRGRELGSVSAQILLGRVLCSQKKGLMRCFAGITMTISGIFEFLRLRQYGNSYEERYL